MDFCDSCGELMLPDGYKTSCTAECVEKGADSAVDHSPPAAATSEDLHVDDDVKDRWEKEQRRLKEKLVLKDVDHWAKHHIMKDNSPDFPGMQPLQYVAGVDISFVKGDSVNACAAFVVIELPELKVVYEDLSMVELTAPYIPGFLAFREAHFLTEKFEALMQKAPQFVPQVIMVDGNGILHPREADNKPWYRWAMCQVIDSNELSVAMINPSSSRIVCDHVPEFGLACHLGVLLDVPSLGVAKKLFQVDGLEKNQDHQDRIKDLKEGGDTFPLVGVSGKTLGKALRSCDATTNPVYVSPGHKISLDTALWVVKKCCTHRVPEPVRQADIRSREYLRVHFLKTNVQKKGRNRKKLEGCEDSSG